MEIVVLPPNFPPARFFGLDSTRLSNTSVPPPERYGLNLSVRPAAPAGRSVALGWYEHYKTMTNELQETDGVLALISESKMQSAPAPTPLLPLHEFVPA